MSDETPNRPSGISDGRGHHGGSAGEQSPLQARAAFIKNRSWESVISYNRGACARGGAQHGPNPESYAACQRKWEHAQSSELAFLELLEFLKSCHRDSPFLFFNGNTFVELARQIGTVLFGEAPTLRCRDGIRVLDDGRVVWRSSAGADTHRAARKPRPR